jgi:hypothetical protein
MAEGADVEMNGDTKHFTGSDELNFKRDNMEIKQLYQEKNTTSKLTTLAKTFSGFRRP